MRMTFVVYSRRPLGRLVDQFLQFVDSSAFIGIDRFWLRSRSSRADLRRAELCELARRSSNDGCTIQSGRGSIDLTWHYGPTRGVQHINGLLSVDARELTEFQRFLTSLCGWAAAVYAYSDLRKVVDRDVIAVQGDLYRKESFYSLYWYNYFGPEYASIFRLDTSRNVEGIAIEEGTDKSLVVINGSPGRPSSAAEELGRLSGIFKKYSPYARFPQPVEIDFSEVRNLPAPGSAMSTIGAIVGPADSFICSVGSRAARFRAWARSKGEEPRSEAEFVRVLRQYAHAIEEEEGLLQDGIAAYGELVREKMKGVWRKSRVFHHGEPVVAKPGKPWTSRRVVFEILRALKTAN